MNPIKVLFVQPVLAPYSIARYRELARCDGLQVSVALEADTFEERQGWSSQPIEGCEITVLKGFRYQKTFIAKDGAFTNKYTKVIPYGLIGKIIAVRPDAVVVCNPTEFLFARIARLFARFSIGLILEDTPVSEGRKGKIVQWARKLLLRNSDFVFCFSKDAQLYAQQIKIRGRLFRSSWSIDPDLYRKSREQISIRRSALHSGDMKFLYVGALSELKGVRALLRVWGVFRESVQDVCLVLVGEGELRAELERYIDDNNIGGVEFSGYLSYEETSMKYYEADVFVLPTLGDLFSLVVTEAMASGLPVLTTIYNGARELVEDGVNGYIFDPLREQEFLMALQKTYYSRSGLLQMGEESSRKIGEYTHDKVMENMCRDIQSFFR